MEFENQKHPLAFVSEVFRDAERCFGRQSPHHGAFVACGNDHDRPADALRERVLYEFFDLAAALSDGGEYGRVEPVSSREHGKKRGFADARAGEDADALTGA